MWRLTSQERFHLLMRTNFLHTDKGTRKEKTATNFLLEYGQAWSHKTYRGETHKRKFYSVCVSIIIFSQFYCTIILLSIFYEVIDLVYLWHLNKHLIRSGSVTVTNRLYAFLSPVITKPVWYLVSFHWFPDLCFNKLFVKRRVFSECVFRL